MNLIKYNISLNKKKRKSFTRMTSDIYHNIMHKTI